MGPTGPNRNHHGPKMEMLYICILKLIGNGKILKVDQKISVGSHASDIAEALGALNIEKR